MPHVTNLENTYNDERNAIRHYGDWVISVAESGDDMLQERFLSLLPQMFTIFEDRQSDRIDETSRAIERIIH